MHPVQIKFIFEQSLVKSIYDPSVILFNVQVLQSAAKGEMGPLVVAGGGGSGGKALESGTMISYTEKQQGGCSSSSNPSAASCLPKGVGNWLALATPTPAQKDSNRG